MQLTPSPLLTGPPKLEGHGGLQAVLGPVQGGTCVPPPGAGSRLTEMMLVFNGKAALMLEVGSVEVEKVYSPKTCLAVRLSRYPWGHQAPLIRSLMAYYILGNNMIHIC